VPEDIQQISCRWCDATAVYEVIDPTCVLLCEDCAEERRDENLDLGWVQSGEATYLSEVEEALDETWRQYNETGNPVRISVLMGNIKLLERELWRAREAYVSAGGKPEPTAYELEKQRAMLDFFGGET